MYSTEKIPIRPFNRKDARKKRKGRKENSVFFFFRNINIVAAHRAVPVRPLMFPCTGFED